MAATAVHPFDYQAEGQPAPAEENQFVQMPAPAEENQFVQMRDDQPPMHPDDGMMYMNEEEALAIEKRGRRLRRAALATGILSVLSIVCMIYTTIAVRWVIVDWTHAELTAYSIADNMVAFKIGILCDVAMIILQTFIGVLISMILIGAGVNPAMSIMAAVFKIMQLAIMGANVIHLFVASILLDRDLAISSTITNTFFSSYSAQDSIGTNLVYLFLVMNKYGNIFAQVFGGINMCLFGFIILMWGVFPRFLGYTIFLSGPAYILNSLLYCFWPGYDGELAVMFMIPIIISEFGLAGWLLANTPHPAKNREFAIDFRSPFK